MTPAPGRTEELQHGIIMVPSTDPRFRWSPSRRRPSKGKFLTALVAAMAGVVGLAEAAGADVTSPSRLRFGSPVPHGYVNGGGGDGIGSGAGLNTKNWLNVSGLYVSNNHAEVYNNGNVISGGLPQIVYLHMDGPVGSSFPSVGGIGPNVVAVPNIFAGEKPASVSNGIPGNDYNTPSVFSATTAATGLYCAYTYTDTNFGGVSNGNGQLVYNWSQDGGSDCYDLETSGCCG